MAGFLFEKQELEGSVLIENFHAGDNRGGFTKCFEKGIYRQAGIDMSLDETFVSVSAKNVIRGLHFQLNNPQAKLVSVLNGAVSDVIVDIRPESKDFGKWRFYELSAENARALYVPRGFAHGFLALTDNTIMLYQCDGKYDKDTDTGIRFDDKDLGIEWPIDLKYAICSEKDKSLMSFKEYCDIKF